MPSFSNFIALEIEEIDRFLAYCDAWRGVPTLNEKKVGFMKFCPARVVPGHFECTSVECIYNFVQS